MTVEEEQIKVKKKNVMVAVRIDRTDRLLLNWALVKVAEPGDHVVVLHVCRSVSEISSEENHPCLDGYLEVYKGLCNVKQLDLVGQVSRGGSIRKVIVREAKLHGSTVVVVGINRINAFGGWLSTARYCSKRLSPATTVLAVHNGRVVYQRGSSKQPPGILGDWKLSLYPIPSLNLKESQSCTSLSVPSENSSPKMIQNFEDGSIRNSSSHVSLNSIASSADIKHDNLIHVDEEKEHVSSSGIAEGAKQELSEPKLGWPLLKSSTSAILDLETKRESEARKMSVVQWVMKLPNRLPSHHIRSKSESHSNTSISESGSVSSENKMKKCFSAWGKLPKELELLLVTNSSNCKWFSYEELKDATSQFSSGNVIGSGGSSRVYKGYLTDGKTVAVKILKMSKEAWTDFALEVHILSSLKHKHITPLLGVCLDQNELILVYDFLSNGNLEENLHAKEKSGLSWEVRFNVAVGVADAINYLHKESSQPVIHRDIKSSNILLSNEFEPQLSDFGLAIWAPKISSHETHTDVVGTFGYLAPEYFMYGRVSDKIDVYSFGVVLLELLSGRKPISTETPKGQESLVMWAKPILESGDIVSILDPNLEGKFNEVQMRRMVLAVTLCITRTPQLRPKMNEVLELLQGEKDVEEWVSSHVNVPQEADYQDGDEAYLDSSIETHLGVALLDVEDTNTSFSSVEQSNHLTFEDYLKERWSRSSSFN